MALAALTDDRQWFYFDVYEHRGSGIHAVLVQIVKQGPVKAHPDDARAMLRELKKQHASAEVFGYVYGRRGFGGGWTRWP